LTGVPESRSSGAIPSEGAAAGVETSDHVGESCWSAVRRSSAFGQERNSKCFAAMPNTGHQNPATIAYLLCQSTNAVNPIDSYDSVIYELPDTGVADLLRLGFGVNQADSCGRFLLTVACSRLRLHSVLLLLSSGANTELREPDGNTALLCAIDVSQHNPVAAHEIVKALIDAGADIEARGWMDKTPFLKACSRGCLENLQLLVSRGCDIHAEARDVVNTSGPDLASIFNTSHSFQQYVRSLYRL
jgi:uncharacterized protein